MRFTATVSAQAVRLPASLAVQSPRVGARTANAALSLGGVVEDVRLATVTGSIDVTASGVARIRLQTMDGRVTVAGSTAFPTSIDVDTHSGAIDVTLPTTSLPRLVLHAQSTRRTIDTTTAAHGGDILTCEDGGLANSKLQ